MPRGIAKFIFWIGLGLLYIPLVGLVLSSFGPLTGPWSFQWYVKAFTDPSTQSALINSLVVAGGASILSVLLGTAAAFALNRYDFFGKKVFSVVSWIPFVMPEIVMALSLLIWFSFLRLTLGVFSIMLAHVTFTLSYVILTVGARLEGLDPSIEDAARDLGAGSFQVFRWITFPLILPGIAAGGALSFILSFDDFLITFFTGGVGSDTLPVKIYSMIRFGVSPEISALSTLLLLLTVLLVSTVKVRPV